MIAVHNDACTNGLFVLLDDISGSSTFQLDLSNLVGMGLGLRFG